MYVAELKDVCFNCVTCHIMLKFIQKKGKEKKKCELHIVMTYRANRIKIFYIPEFASFCKKKMKEKRNMKRESASLFC